MTTSTRLPPIPDNYYDRLGVPRQVATEDEIKAGFRKVARKVHPDTNPDPLAQEWFAAVSSAYAVLSDPDKREMYDLGLPLEAEADDADAEMEFDVVDEGEAAGAGGEATPGPPPAWQDPHGQPWTSTGPSWTTAPHAPGRVWAPPPPVPLLRRPTPSTWTLSLEERLWAGLASALLTGFSVLTGITWPALPHTIAVIHHVTASPKLWVVLLGICTVAAALSKGAALKLIPVILKGTPLVVTAIAVVTWKLTSNFVKLGVIMGFSLTRLVRRRLRTTSP